MGRTRFIGLAALGLACSAEQEDPSATSLGSSASASTTVTTAGDDSNGDSGEGDSSGGDPSNDDSDPSADSNDDDDPTGVGGSCDFDMTAAIRLSVDVTWAGGLAVLEGAGAIDIWLLGDLDAESGEVGLTGRVCRIDLPDFETGLLAGNETYGTMFPDSIWTSATMPTIDAAASISTGDPGALLHLERGAVVLGATMADPLNGAWPADWHQLATTDHDGDAMPGVTAAAKTGGNYAFPRIDILNSNARAAEIFLVSRTTMEFNGTVDTCDSAAGEATLTMENHSVGCEITGGGQCSDGQTTTLDNNLPEFVISGGSFELLRLDDGAGCDAVFAALP